LHGFKKHSERRKEKLDPCDAGKDWEHPRSTEGDVKIPLGARGGSRLYCTAEVTERKNSMEKYSRTGPSRATGEREKKEGYLKFHNHRPAGSELIHLTVIFRRGRLHPFEAPPTSAGPLAG